jgi:hypothetical protein
MKLNYSFWVVLVMLVLLATCGIFFKRSTSYSLKNRQLILENDSLMSVNIELTHQLQVLQSNSSAIRKQSTALRNRPDKR